VINNADFQWWQELLVRIDKLLIVSGVEDEFIRLCEENLSPEEREKLSGKRLESFRRSAAQALRCMILKMLKGFSYRKLSENLAESELSRWFIGLPDEGAIRVPAKSTLQDYSKRLPVSQLREIVETLIQSATMPEGGGDDAVPPLNLAETPEMDTVWIDSTALEANIHFPVDWLLLRDAARTLLKNIACIRRHGLKHRITDPLELLAEMNKLCVKMTQGQRKRDNKKHRKKVLREMKKLMKLIEDHARRYRELLDNEWQKTDWTRKQVEQKLRQMDNILEQLPAAVRQAHERIIGERALAADEKLLSLYEPDTRVLVRGKAGARSEFGHKLLIAEQAQGLIVDWQVCEDGAPADSALLPGCLQYLYDQSGGQIKAAATDRGFDSAANHRLLEELGIKAYLCPKNPNELRQAMRDPEFAQVQKRRAQTEGRIGILKAKFLPGAVNAKGLKKRQEMTAWAILTHNLWLLARLPQRQTEADAESPPPPSMPLAA
jgi:IS5 family transposase